MTWNELRTSDRRSLERRGWRTSLAYRENLERDGVGLLADARVEWCAEAERIEHDSAVTVITAVAPTRAAAWRTLRSTAAQVDAGARAEAHAARRAPSRQHADREKVAS